MFDCSENYRSDLFDLDRAARELVGFNSQSQYDFHRAAWDIAKDFN